MEKIKFGIRFVYREDNINHIRELWFDSKSIRNSLLPFMASNKKIDSYYASQKNYISPTECYNYSDIIEFVKLFYNVDHNNACEIVTNELIDEGDNGIEEINDHITKIKVKNILNNDKYENNFIRFFIDRYKIQNDFLLIFTD